jgi:hypothetical protein
MKRLGLSIKKVKAVFVSHEHGDHIHGVASLSKKHQLPVYISRETLHHGKLAIREDRIFTLTSDVSFLLGNISVRAFPKFHDASDPYSFMVSSPTVNVGSLRISDDLENVIRHFSQCRSILNRIMMKICWKMEDILMPKNRIRLVGICQQAGARIVYGPSACFHESFIPVTLIEEQ